MSLKLAVIAAIASADAVVSLVDAATAAGRLSIYEGTPPTTPETALDPQTQAALVTFDLPRPAFQSASSVTDGGFSDANPIAAVLATASGTASFFRLLDGDNNCIVQGSVSDPDGDGDIKVSSTSVLSGVEVSVISLGYLQPKSFA